MRIGNCSDPDIAFLETPSTARDWNTTYLSIWVAKLFEPAVELTHLKSRDSQQHYA
ncbi:hypothetical protein COO91_08275 [Nostoc flagelliforme CCNUN1]|uniref:Uncharacterized protein n=1 Tax=Nostoc flagelliforme CCNUN1 TaxID=2038116 RepID=A0A2K8T373_9NOSO|nr:hypothetical protein COO91_08275 [Nostoc flagelliforme CCNUN1]